MKAAILLLICLAVITITQAGRHQHDRHDRRRDNKDDERRHDSSDNNRSQENRQDSRENKENNKQDNRRDNRQDARNVERQSNRQESRQDSRQHSKDSREKNEQDRRQDSGENNAQANRQNSWQQNRQPWRDIVIQNRGKIVNNGVQREGQQRYTPKQELLDRLGYTQTIGKTTTTNLEMLLKQKFLLTILLNVNDVQQEEQLEELGQTLILDEQKYIGSIDDDMRHLVQLCIDDQMLHKTDKFNGLNPIHLRQLHGLYKLLVRARDWDTLQRNACFARMHLNRVLFVNALMLAVKERRDTKQLIMPAMNEILPELFYDKQLLKTSKNINLADLVMDRVATKPQLNDLMASAWRRPVVEGNTHAGQQRWGGGMQPKKTWQEWRQEKLDRQAGRTATPTAQNELSKLVLAEAKVDVTTGDDLDKRISYLTQDVGLSNFWYSLNIDCIRQMRLPTTKRRETEERQGLSDKKQRNKEQATIDDLNNGRLLHANRRRWKQKQDLTSAEQSDERQKALLTKQIIGSDEEETKELTRQRQTEERQGINVKDTQRIDSRQNSKNADKTRTKAQQRSLVIEAVLKIIRDERQKKSKNLDTSKILRQQNNLNKDYNEREKLLKVNRRRLDSREERQSREDSRENVNIKRKDSDEQLRQNRDEKLRTMEDTKIDGKRLLKINRRRWNLGDQQNSLSLKTTVRNQNSVDEDSREDLNRNSIEDERLLKVNRRRLNARNMLEGDMDMDMELTQRKMRVQNSSEKRRQGSDEQVRQGSSEETRQALDDRDERRDSNEDMEIQQENSIDGKRLLKVNRRRLNTRNMLGRDMNDLEIRNSLRLSENRRQDSDERERQDSNEETRKSINEERLLRVNRRWLNSRNMLGTKLNTEERRQNSIAERQQDSEEERRQDMDENMGMLERNSVDEQRLLRVNRRLLNKRNMIGANLDKHERRQESSLERQQDSDEQKSQESNKNIGKLERNSIDDQRLLRANRRLWNKRNMLGNNSENLNSAQRTLKEERRQDSSLERRRDSDEQWRKNSNEDIDISGRVPIDDQRLLRVNRRWLNTRNMLRGKLDNQQITQRLRKLQDSSEENRQDSDERRRQDSEEQIETLDRNSIDDQRLLHVNRRRLNQNSRSTTNGNKSIWPQRIQDDRYEMDQMKEKTQDSDEAIRQDVDEREELRRNGGERLLKQSRRRVTLRSLESSSQEDSNERMSSKVQKKSSEESSEESREKRNRPTTKARLLAIGRRRLPRSVYSQLGEERQITELRTGEMKLANMQQMLARLRMERLSHQLEDQQKQKKPDIRPIESLNQRIAERRDNRELLLQVQNVEQILKTIIAEELQLLSTKNEINLKQSNILEQIGRILMNRVSNSDLNVFQLFSHLMEVSGDENNNSQMGNMAQQLREPAFSSLMEGILNIANTYSDKLPSYDSQVLRLDDVELKDVKVDKLQTYFDNSDVDLTNTLDQQALREQNIELKNIQTTPVARQQRLNHKSFSIKLDISSKRERQVVIRTFLGPKLDASGNELSLNENRRNFMLLDAFTSKLLPGQNSIKRKSSDISWTSRDSTPLSQLYREVMLAIEGTNDLQLERLTGNNLRFPHRLLLPRGLPQGLPMQLFIIVTPQSESDALLQQQLQTETAVLSMGTAALGLDTLPLGFPLDRRIDNEQNILVPNAILKDISIYHDGEIDI